MPGTPQVSFAGWLERCRWLLGRRQRFTVTGNSMAPVLAEGDHVYVKNPETLRPGDIVVAQHPFKQSVKVVKQISAIDKAGNLELIGQNPGSSTDSRTLGNFAPNLILGIVTSRAPARAQEQR